VRWLARFACRQADYVIVTNSLLVEQVRELKSLPLVLPDPLPVIVSRPMPPRFQTGQRHTITFICSFQYDEPVCEFLEGVEDLAGDVRVFVTGRPNSPHIRARFASESIVFTGFLDRTEYEGLIQSSDLLVDLTTLPDCLVCGAYEALAAGVPAVLSNHRPLRELFSKGYLFADNTPASYRECVDRFFQEPEPLRTKVVELREEFSSRWRDHFNSAYARVFGIRAGRSLEESGLPGVEQCC
jgi:glycosyltransferase involved in cell wall biosynthesis